MLTMTTAQLLLQSIGKSAVRTLDHLTNTNDVFKIVTASDGNFYVKFHTSPWYKDAEDTQVVVRREAAVFEFLRRKGIVLDYQTWTDCTRRIVNRSVLITSELSGIPLPTAVKESPAECDHIMIALAQFLARLHNLTFPRAGYIEFSGDPDMPFALNSDEHAWWHSHSCHTAENFRSMALTILESTAHILPSSLAIRLQASFEAVPETIGAAYQPPRFVINNYHPFHVHVAHNASGWRVTGLYDFEAVSSGNALFDVVGNELQITPIIGNLSWRPTFYRAYGRWPSFEMYKTMFLCFLLRSLGGAPNMEVPDPTWLIHALPGLVDATDYHQFTWYPS